MVFEATRPFFETRLEFVNNRKFAYQSKGPFQQRLCSTKICDLKLTFKKY